MVRDGYSEFLWTPVIAKILRNFAYYKINNNKNELT